QSCSLEAFEPIDAFRCFAIAREGHQDETSFEERACRPAYERGARLGPPHDRFQLSPRLPFRRVVDSRRIADPGHQELADVETDASAGRFRKTAVDASRHLLD